MAFMLTTQPLSTPLSPHSGGGNPSAQTRPQSRPSVARPVPHIQNAYSLEHRLNISVARILSGLHFFAKKVDALKHGLNLPQNLSHVAKTVLKIDSCSGWGCTSCPRGALAHFSCKLGLKKNFHRPGGAGAPTAPPGYALYKLLQ